MTIFSDLPALIGWAFIFGCIVRTVALPVARACLRACQDAADVLLPSWELARAVYGRLLAPHAQTTVCPECGYDPESRKLMVTGKGGKP